jgi:hypothetical protein
MTSRPPPWTIKELAECFIVRDANGQALAYVYFEEEPGRPAASLIRPFRPSRRRYAGSRDVSDDIPDNRLIDVAVFPRYLRQRTRYPVLGHR